LILHTKIQDTFIKKVRQSGIDEALEWLGNCKNTQNESWPAPVKLQWDTESGDAVLEISEYMDFHNTQICKTQGGSCEINNLKIGQKYYWRVNKGEVFCFETANTFPRFIRIDGITNVRDLGGLRIKQGLVYRGSALNEDPGSDDGHAITSEGRYTFCEELGMSMSTAITIFAKKMSREKRIPFEVSVDPFYSEQNRLALQKSMEQLSNGQVVTKTLEELVSHG